MYLNDGAFIESDGQAVVDASYPLQQGLLDTYIDTLAWERRRQRLLAERQNTEDRAKLAIAVSDTLQPQFAAHDERITQLESRMNRASEVVGGLHASLTENLDPRVAALEDFRRNLIQLNIPEAAV